MRGGSLFHYSLPGGREITVYPLLFGNALMCSGEAGKDSWDIGYTYKTCVEAIDAAIAWHPEMDGPPPGDPIRKQVRGAR